MLVLTHDSYEEVKQLCFELLSSLSLATDNPQTNLQRLRIHLSKCFS